jgi:hypothetical protein
MMCVNRSFRFDERQLYFHHVWRVNTTLLNTRFMHHKKTI